MRSRVTSSAFSPPAHAPIAMAHSAASQIGRPASRQSLPKTTAARPMSELTERSIPPVAMTGVSATASSPSSTLSRSTSKKLSALAKRVPMPEKIATSTASRIASTR